MSDVRRIILKAFLWSLALAAAAGVLAVLTSSDALARVTGTIALAAGAALLMLPMSVWADKKWSRPAGLFGMAGVMAVFLIILALIWLDLGYSRRDEALGLTCASTFTTTFVGVLLLLLAGTRSGFASGVVGLTFTGLAYLATLIGAWGDSHWFSDSRFWETAGALALMVPMAVAVFAGLGTIMPAFTNPDAATPLPPGPDNRPWRWAGVLASAATLFMLLWHTWVGGGGGQRAFACVVAFAAYVGFANLVLAVPLTAGQRWVAWGTLSAGFTVAAASVGMVFVGYPEYEPLSRVLASAGIVTACGGMALVVLRLVNRRVEPEVVATEFLTVSLACPRCRRRQDLRLGGAACAGCGLRIEVRIEAPRCRRCGYMLYLSQGDRCPECGEPTAEPATSEAPPGPA